MTEIDLVTEAIEHNRQFAQLDEVVQTIELPVYGVGTQAHIYTAKAGAINLSVITEFVDETQKAMLSHGRTPDSSDFFEFADNLPFATDAPDPNDPEWDGYTSEVWFGFPDPYFQSVEVIYTHRRAG